MYSVHISLHTLAKYNTTQTSSNMLPSYFCIINTVMIFTTTAGRLLVCCSAEQQFHLQEFSFGALQSTQKYN